MLRKFVCIKNVGRFANSNASGDVELKRYALIFGENGRGKTTLCAILRSLQSGNADFVNGRKTLPGIDPPQINVLTDAGNAIFNNGAWSSFVPEIMVFDSTFISENVYAGDAVDLDHRRSLYNVIVGAQGVALAQQIESLDAQSRAQSTELREKSAAVQSHIPSGSNLTVEAFATLEQDSDIDNKIVEKERELDAVKQATQIRIRAGLAQLTAPIFDRAGLETIIARTVEGIAAETQQLINKQVIEHAMIGRGHEWLREGLGYIHDTAACPFCGQGLAHAAALIENYKNYFSAAYDQLRKDIAAARQQIETNLSDRNIAALERIADQNAASVEFWARFCDLVPPALPAGAGDTLRALRESATTLIDLKAAGPLELVAPDETFAAACTAFTELTSAITAYNGAVRSANAVVTAKKTSTGGANTATVETQLARLRAVKKRQETAPDQACTEYAATAVAKQATEQSKENVRRQLDEYTKTVIGPYENSINDLLGDFNAGFRITNTAHGYAGGVASSTYQISINNTPVELGDGATPLDRPSFRNTLSSGDKSTLALAFFLAQLLRDPNKASKIVAFDDPFNSQDSFRRECTVARIKRCGDMTAQVIVLSHDGLFLKRIWDRIDAADRKALTIARIDQTNSTIRPWDIETELQAAYQAQRRALMDFYLRNEGEPRDVVQKIRPVLETHYRRLGEGLLGDADNLGGIVLKIRTAGTAHHLYPVCDKLEELNLYTCRYHHGESPNYAAEPIDNAELQGYVSKTLSITDG